MWRVTFSVSVANLDEFVAALEPFVLSVAWIEGNPNPEIWMIEGVSKVEPDAGAINQALVLTAALLGQGTPVLQKEEIPDCDWMESVYQSFQPQQIGEYYIYGSHNQSQIPPQSLGLEINAATAFGSGEHQTTRGCLLALTELAKTVEIKRALDMGCGSGILALAIAKRWNLPVVAADNDPECVRVTQANAELNHCQELISPILSEGFADSQVQSEGPYDLIMANILAKPLCDMAEAMAKVVAEQGYVVLSGLLVTQEPQVTETYQAQGLQLLTRYNIDDWATLVLRKQ